MLLFYIAVIRSVLEIWNIQHSVGRLVPLLAESIESIMKRALSIA